MNDHGSHVHFRFDERGSRLHPRSLHLSGRNVDMPPEVGRAAADMAEGIVRAGRFKEWLRQNASKLGWRCTWCGSTWLGEAICPRCGDDRDVVVDK